MAIEWTLSLEKTGGKDNQLKDPVGYRQDITEVVVRSGMKSNVTQFDLFERVSPPQLYWCRVSFVESLGVRKVANEPATNVLVSNVDDGVQSVHLHHHVHSTVRHHAFQGHLQRQLGLRAIRAQRTKPGTTKADLHSMQHGHYWPSCLQVLKHGHHSCPASGLGWPVLTQSSNRELSSNHRLITNYRITELN